MFDEPFEEREGNGVAEQAIGVMAGGLAGLYCLMVGGWVVAVSAVAGLLDGRSKNPDSETDQ